MANYGGFRYFHWSNPKYVQIYEATDTSLQDWGYQQYRNNKWFFAYMDSKYPTRKNADGTLKLGLIDSINKLIITTVVALLRYVRRGYLYIFGGALIAAGGLAMLLEFLLNLTFGVHQTFFWSFYPLAAGVLLGVMLIIIAVCPPLRRSLHRKFFL